MDDWRTKLPMTRLDWVEFACWADLLSVQASGDVGKWSLCWLSWVSLFIKIAISRDKART